MSTITEDRIREIIKEELVKLSLSVESNTESVDGEYIKFIVGVGLNLDGEQISWSDD